MDTSQRSAARVFGITYLVSLLIIMVAFSRFYAPYLVWENGEQTARQIVGHEHAIRIYLAGCFLHGIAMIVLLAALYVILRSVGRGLALFAAFLKLTYAVMWFLVLLEIFGALRVLAGAGSLHALGQNGLAALAGSLIDSGRDAYYVGLVFNGLASGVFAWVFLQSGYVPRVLAIWGVLSSAFEAFCGFIYLMHPAFGSALSPDWYELPSLSFELLLCFCLLVLGFGAPKVAALESTQLASKSI